MQHSVTQMDCSQALGYSQFIDCIEIQNVKGQGLQVFNPVKLPRGRGYFQQNEMSSHSLPVRLNNGNTTEQTNPKLNCFR